MMSDPVMPFAVTVPQGFTLYGPLTYEQAKGFQDLLWTTIMFEKCLYAQPCGSFPFYGDLVYLYNGIICQNTVITPPITPPTTLEYPIQTAGIDLATNIVGAAQEQAISLCSGHSDSSQAKTDEDKGKHKDQASKELIYEYILGILRRTGPQKSAGRIHFEGTTFNGRSNMISALLLKCHGIVLNNRQVSSRVQTMKELYYFDKDKLELLGGPGKIKGKVPRTPSNYKRRQVRYDELLVPTTSSPHIPTQALTPTSPPQSDDDSTVPATNFDAVGIMLLAYLERQRIAAQWE
ncbi:hypothetical protein NEOLI_001096 [Neolecta irregularis DAH-3]|uniref:Uncharacterized protein n=1 Tax=Neolecta irregularis (strain DAH-3) TaxID=1198029 RepID=A0A1U7LWJ3_NEOID|nr:hypothetical protein NEOLI_001096 [Neolecta irregularis DAH-3]|eukprot:OLL27046.1 hypothetical protein NEOLI_001096 [Neolecta irregularis DAH-3]